MNFMNSFFIIKNICANLVKVVMKGWTLSHEEASVEHEFSVDNTLMVENLSIIRLVSYQFIHNYMISSNITLNISTTASLCFHIKSAHQIYLHNRENQAKCWVLNEKQLKACVCYFLSNFIFLPNDSPSKTMKKVFYFI